MTNLMIKAPGYLRKETKDFFNSVLKEYELQDHHIKILTLICQALDTAETAREIIVKDGAYFYEKDKPKAHPAINVSRDAMITAARLLRELNLEIEPPGAAGRPPGLYK